MGGVKTLIWVRDSLRRLKEAKEISNGRKTI
jgi:hypothetical protein